jgi:hypothetical protein
VEAQRAADRDHELAHVQRVGVAKLRVREVAGLGAQHREVRQGVGAHHLGTERTSIGEGRLRRAVAPLDDVRRGEHVAVGGYDNRAATPLGATAPGAPSDAQVGDRGAQPLGHRRDGARVGVERLGVRKALISLGGLGPVDGALDQSQPSHEANLATGFSRHRI